MISDRVNLLWILNCAEIFSIINGVPLHKAFCYHQFIVLIWLKYCWKGRKITSHPSSLPMISKFKAKHPSPLHTDFHYHPAIGLSIWWLKYHCISHPSCRHMVIFCSFWTLLCIHHLLSFSPISPECLYTLKGFSILSHSTILPLPHSGW